MARPTSDPKSSKIIIRINNETRERLEKGAKRCGISLSQHIRGILSGNNTPKDSDDLKDIRQMARCFGVETGDLLHQVCEGLNDGSLTSENGKVRGVPDIDLTDFYEVCHERGVRPQEALDKLVQNMRRGKRD